MLPPISGLEGLDIGCGEGSNTRKLANWEPECAASIFAPTFIRHAAKPRPRSAGHRFRNWRRAVAAFADDSFDFVTAFMSLMDMPEPRTGAQRGVPRAAAGRLFCSFPSRTPASRRLRKVLRNGDGSVRAVEVAGYFTASTATWKTLVVLHAARRGRERVAARSRGPVSPHAEFMGEILCQAGFQSGVWRAVGIGEVVRVPTWRTPASRAVSAHPGSTRS